MAWTRSTTGREAVKVASVVLLFAMSLLMLWSRDHRRIAALQWQSAEYECGSDWDKANRQTGLYSADGGHLWFRGSDGNSKPKRMCVHGEMFID
jgi:hypothetical protein